MTSAARLAESTTPDTEAARLARAVSRLVQVPSVNPFHAGPRAEQAGPVGEAVIARTLAEDLRRCGAAEVFTEEVEPGRPNVYAFFPGRTERLVVVDVHTDTVSVEHMTDPPFDGRVESGRVWGRGALDSKATLGVLLTLLEEWQRQGLRPEATLLVTATAGEEAGGLLGATRFRSWAMERGLVIDQILVAEPTGFRPVHGLRSLVLAEVTTHGAAAHSAQPELGDNAIEAMAPVIAAFVQENARLREMAAATELGCGTVSVTQVDGGSGSNIIPDRCSITVGRRIVPGENPAEVLDRLRTLAQSASRLPCAVRSLLPEAPDGGPAWPAFYQAPDSALVQRLAEICGTVPGVAPYGANALRYSGLAHEVVVFGPGSIDDAHQATENVAVADLVRMADALRAWLLPAAPEGKP
ncbi:M20 family metallopeptidase [Streptomyces polygonati]|uniref:M20 family metallopeptidase n=1 Tax=Streptomyces polygonati TaxID=1617087 RepID=A0ABV8HMV1_9ACTN